MAKVRILKAVCINPKDMFMPGDEADLPKRVADGWVKAGYAERIRAIKIPKEDERDTNAL